jgi:hypothetical protein
VSLFRNFRTIAVIVGCRGPRKAPYGCDRLREWGTSFPLLWELLFGETIPEIVFLMSCVVKRELALSGMWNDGLYRFGRTGHHSDQSGNCGRTSDKENHG